MQLYFILPDFYTNFYTNQKIVQLKYRYPEWFRYNELFFEGQRGNFPYCCWNGGKNTCQDNQNNFCLYPKIINFNENSEIPTFFNCANIALTIEDYEDSYGHLILSHNMNGANKIEISDLKFFDFLKEKYPQYNFILSNECFLFQPEAFTADFLNHILEEKINFSLLPEHLSYDMNFLKNIKYKNKVSICINPLPCISCSSYITCKKMVHEQQINYSAQDIIQNCDIKKQFEQLYINCSKYAQLGFNHFYFSSYFFNQLPYEYFLVKFFIKPEFEEQALGYLLKGGKK